MSSPALLPLLALCALQDAPPARDAAQTVALPRDPKAVVLSLDYRGGYGPPRLNPEPYVVVLRDGTVRVPDRGGEGEGATGKLSEEELAELMTLAVHEHKLLEYDREKAKRELTKAQAAGGGVIIMDAADTVVAVRTADRSVEASFNALEAFWRRHPEVESLAHLHAVARALDVLGNVVVAGGKSVVDRAVKLANEKFARQKPGGVIRFEDLRRVERREDGGTSLSFLRWKSDEDWARAEVLLPHDGEPVIQLTLPQKRR